MTIQQPMEGQNPSTNKHQKNDEVTTHTENGEHDIQEQEDKTVRLPYLSQKYWMRWLSYQKDKDDITKGLLDGNSPQQQKTGASVTVPVDKVPQIDLQSQHGNPPFPPQVWQHVPETEVPFVLQKRGAMTWLSPDWIWPTIIILSAVAAWLANFVFTGIPMRPLIVLCFLSVCPGMVLIRFLRLKESIVEWVLAIALSFALDALIATAQLYAREWSLEVTLNILIILCVGCAIAQLVVRFPASISLPRQVISKRLGVLWSKKIGILLLVSFFLLSVIIGTSLWFSEVYLGNRVTIATSSQLHNTPSLSKTGPMTVPSASAQTTPTPVPTTYPVISGTYNGTIGDLSSNVSTSLLLTGVRQSQGKISGYLVIGSGLRGSGPFLGTINTEKHIQFAVTDGAGHATVFFEGVMLSTTSLSGYYYRCSSNSAQNSQCSRSHDSYGLWSAVLVS